MGIDHGYDMKKILTIYLLFLCFCISCSILDSEVTQYIAIKKSNGKIQPVAKVVYKVFIDKQEVVYWIERPNESRGSLYKLQNSIVVDAKNWEGYHDYGSPIPYSTKAEYVNGKFINSVSVSWWVWHFETDPRPSNISLILGSLFVAFWIIGIACKLIQWWKKR